MSLIGLPSQRERREDILPLALHFTSRANQAHQRNVHLAANALERLDWPGNIRELGNVIERVVLLADQPVVHAGDLSRFLPEALVTPARPASRHTPPAEAPAPLARDYESAGSHDGN